MSISLGLVGLGAFGSAFADLFMNHPLVNRVALCDREPERIAEFANRPSWQKKFHQKDAYSSFDEICKSDLDALVIITQPWLHAPQAIQAMEAGKHVYSAVPIISLPDGDEILDWCDKLVETSSRTGMHYMLGETTYYHAPAMYCRRRAQEGAFGDFVYSEGEYLHDADSPVSNLNEVTERRFSSKAGLEWQEMLKSYRKRNVRSGPMHYPTHSTSGPISVMNAHAVKVCAWGNTAHIDAPYPAHNLLAFTNEVALFQMSNGTTMRIVEARKIASLNRETFHIYGTEGSFENDRWMNRYGETELTEDEMRDPLPDEVMEAFQKLDTKEGVYGGHGGSHAYLVHEFVDAIAHDRSPAINAWEAVRYMAPGVMAHKSALRDGEILEVPDWGDAPS